jgi:hypothetical protein
MTSDTSDNPYASEYPPDCIIDPSIKALIAHYYRQVDTQGNHLEYSECWVEDGILVVPTGKEIQGREGVPYATTVSITAPKTSQRSEIYIQACGTMFRRDSTDH